MAYKIMYIRKASGGWRKLEEPDFFLKRHQRQLLKHLKDVVPYTFPDYVTGTFGSRAGTHNTAKFHINQDAIVKFDISDFFGSCTKRMVYEALVKHGKMHKLQAAMVAHLCTHEDHIPQGAPTSSYMANLAATDLHLALNAWAEALGCKYSIYVDDMYFSGPESADLPNRVKEIIAIIEQHKFKAKLKKIKRMKRGRKQQIMDVCVAGVPQWDTGEQHTRLAKHKRHIVMCAIHNLKNGKPKTSMRSIAGLISNAKRVGDQGHTKMKAKFAVAVVEYRRHLVANPVQIKMYRPEDQATLVRCGTPNYEVYRGGGRNAGVSLAD